MGSKKLWLPSMQAMQLPAQEPGTVTRDETAVAAEQTPSNGWVVFTTTLAGVQWPALAKCYNSSCQGGC